ncbi:mechanosensitive ion channel family protein [Methanolapillus millepedarum]|uniref:Small-conductance mechanosensitive channel n=1 Tax=Methanolapillus millepedarum TaxID=3028296 RepID=A0AA96ZWH8_9EURY|nr:Small-conductance mechanosensitive channel [Methanosarcinaceae archaeon Ac7]
MLEFLEISIPYTDLLIADLVFALIVLIVGFIIARVLVSIFKKMFSKTSIPVLVSSILVQLLTILLYVAVLLATVSALGVSVSSVILGLSAVIGLILGFGLQDTLTNLAAGIWIAVLGPFKVNDNVTIAGQTGSIKTIGVMATELVTADNVFIMVPNKMVWNAPIINTTRLPTRRFDLTMTFKLVNNSEGTVKAVMDVLNKNPVILKTPEPKIYISNMTDATADLQIRAWVSQENYAVIVNDVKEELLTHFEK